MPGIANFWPMAAQAATVGIFLLLFGAFLELARVLLLPVTAAFVIGTMLGPVADAARPIASRNGSPRCCSCCCSSP